MSEQEKVSSDVNASLRTGVIVLGMHRSGTSAFTRVASLLGCDLPRNLMAGDEGNDLGHWESYSITHLNERILASAGSKWDDWMPLNKGWSQSAVSPAFLAEAQEILRTNYDASALFVLKDPRICRLAPFWLKAIKDLGVRPVIAFPLRNPYEVSSSLAMRDGSDQGYGLLLWLRHVLDAEAATRDLPRHFFNFDQLLSDWSSVVDGFERETGVYFPRRSVAVEAEISAFLTNDARHQRENTAQALNAASPSWVRDAYAILQSWCENGVKVEDYRRLDEIRTEFDIASPSFSRFIMKGVKASKGYGMGAQARSEIEALQHNVAKAELVNAELEQARSEIETLQHNVAKAELVNAELEQARSEIETLQHNVATAELVNAELEQARSEIETLQHNVAKVELVNAELEQARSEIEALQHNVAKAELVNAELEQARSEIETLQHNVAKVELVNAELEQARSEIEALQHNVAKVELVNAELEQARSEIEALQHNVAKAELVNAELEQARSEIKTLQHNVAKAELVNAELEQARSEIETLQHNVAKAELVNAELEQARSEIKTLQHNVAKAELVNAELEQARSEIETLQHNVAKAELVNAQFKDKIETLNKASLRTEAELAELDSALRQRREEASQAWHKADSEKQLRQKAEAEQDRLFSQNEELIAQFFEIDKRIRADSNTVTKAEQKASDAEAAKKEIRLQNEKLIAEMEAQNVHLRQVLSQSTQVDSELAQLNRLYLSARQEVQELTEIVSKADSYRERIDELEEKASKIGVYQDEINALSQRIQITEQAARQVRLLLDERQSENSKLKEMVARQSAQANATSKQSQWLQEAAIVLQKKPKLRALMSSKARQQYSKDLLKASGLFDSDTYLEKNPDVAASGDDPFLHYVRHGLREGRRW